MRSLPAILNGPSRRAWTSSLDDMGRGKGMSYKSMVTNFDRIIDRFQAIPVTGEEKVRWAWWEDLCQILSARQQQSGAVSPL